jgi:hypothetical protein
LPACGAAPYGFGTGFSCAACAATLSTRVRNSGGSAKPRAFFSLPSPRGLANPPAVQEPVAATFSVRAVHMRCCLPCLESRLLVLVQSKGLFEPAEGAALLLQLPAPLWAALRRGCFVGRACHVAEEAGTALARRDVADVARVVGRIGIRHDTRCVVGRVWALMDWRVRAGAKGMVRGLIGER